jgi:hypothetical protein
LQSQTANGLFFSRSRLFKTEQDNLLLEGCRMRRIVLVALIFLLAGYAAAEDKRYSVPINDSPEIGPVDAPVTIIEFLDFQ